MILAGPYSLEVGVLQSRAIMRAMARLSGWRWVDGMGMPPGEQEGPGPRNLPGQGYATHWTPTLEARTDDAVYLQVDARMEQLEPGSVEVIDGEDVELVRAGTELDPEVVLKSRDEVLVAEGKVARVIR